MHFLQPVEKALESYKMFNLEPPHSPLLRSQSLLLDICPINFVSIPKFLPSLWSHSFPEACHLKHMASHLGENILQAINRKVHTISQLYFVLNINIKSKTYIMHL